MEENTNRKRCVDDDNTADNPSKKPKMMVIFPFLKKGIVRDLFFFVRSA